LSYCDIKLTEEEYIKI